ncbi:MAG: hypothetical protein BMS9Abin08_0611 [Gammaproteobacteria bacterium]|nr:MAG: hypothetical protein BMS9Abin08_0611 [Gammaproteobacteria bacterium]
MQYTASTVPDRGMLNLLSKEMLINLSSRRRPGSSALNLMDPGLRRDDDLLMPRQLAVEVTYLGVLCSSIPVCH